MKIPRRSPGFHPLGVWRGSTAGVLRGDQLSLLGFVPKHVVRGDGVDPCRRVERGRRVSAADVELLIEDARQSVIDLVHRVLIHRNGDDDGRRVDAIRLAVGKLDLNLVAVQRCKQAGQEVQAQRFAGGIHRYKAGRNGDLFDRSHGGVVHR